MAASYASEKEAQESIRKGLATFYQKYYPDLVGEKAVAIQQGTDATIELYSRNFFPEMRVDWRSYPNHIGHLQAQGCFRCHDGLHKNREGRAITNDCNACHTILAQGTPEEVSGAKLETQPFRHPVDMGMDVTELKCSECHTGTSGL
ncbi:MAG: hypothetical protein HYU33_07525 [Candidatus Omnitrophica bacterium]|nr:hypothetical protein [Candidatus Omnitrophota bacterium]